MTNFESTVYILKSKEIQSQIGIATFQEHQKFRRVLQKISVVMIVLVQIKQQIGNVEIYVLFYHLLNLEQQGLLIYLIQVFVKMNDIAHTGKSQASAQDIHSKIESQFLQRYAHYLIGDEFDSFLTSSFVHMLHILDSKKVSCEQLINYKTQQINNQNTESQVFFALRNFTFNSFSLMFDQKLEYTNVYSKEEYFRSIRTTQDQANRRHQFVHNPSNSFNQEKQEQNQHNFYELYSNKLAKDQGDILQGEIVIFETRIKYPATKAKQLCYEIKQKIDNLFRSTTRQHQIIRSEYIPYLEEYKYPTIVLIILYNGDVNLDFSKLLQMNQITINRKQFALKVKVYFISKLSLFSHFREVNNQQKTECITDKVVTFYDMNRVRQRRQKVLKEIEIIKKQALVNQNKKKKEQYWKWSITTGFCVVAAIYLLICLSYFQNSLIVFIYIFHIYKLVKKISICRDSSNIRTSKLIKSIRGDQVTSNQGRVPFQKWISHQMFTSKTDIQLPGNRRSIDGKGLCNRTKNYFINQIMWSPLSKNLQKQQKIYLYSRQSIRSVSSCNSKRSIEIKENRKKENARMHIKLQQITSTFNKSSSKTSPRTAKTLPKYLNNQEKSLNVKPIQNFKLQNQGYQRQKSLQQQPQNEEIKIKNIIQHYQQVLDKILPLIKQEKLNK
ncbi:unnamed protein product (macronuclear) [Paramecium tetraurelia]|uniref:Transmembrane protein n=1 Tax=Paramecium tetraurelia TaxID=5888 RepID=A0BTK8_PARTE|nr:uncharacterized protein GSPATT00032107001 [Paramecium tetraurelia]CAK61875.1 unnamed protein product [Paramecium tetraurelia]|eukprot:XP_001429273.1 hypothetical protein (macronuclear) [Paramecium tetraurelia strain d4-2]